MKLNPDMPVHPSIKFVKISNFKSIADCHVELGPLTFLVGPNGSGKSNFLDAIRFVADALRTTVDHALRDRGGINEVRRRSSGRPNHFGIRIEFLLADGTHGHYAFKIAAKPNGGFEVQTEQCSLQSQPPQWYQVKSGQLRFNSAGETRSIPSDRLYLVAASGDNLYRPVYDALANMAFYSLNPDRMREIQIPDSGEILARDGVNATSVYRLLSQMSSLKEQRVIDYLSKVVPGIKNVRVRDFGPRESFEFQMESASTDNAFQFLAANMSDGTLRALGILLALFQSVNGNPLTLIGMEEPEIALHPAATGVLLDALREASRDSQIVVTSHSPDLLDMADVGQESILAVKKDKGDSQIAKLDHASMEVLRSGLYSAGELLRLGQLAPDTTQLFDDLSPQLGLFYGVPKL